jgi:hypothetical protein
MAASGVHHALRKGLEGFSHSIARAGANSGAPQSPFFAEQKMRPNHTKKPKHLK